MTPLVKGLLVGAAQVLLVSSVGAKFLYDRANYPRIWVETAPYDPYLPIRGRYVSIALRVDAARAVPAANTRTGPALFRARLEARNGRLFAVEDEEGGGHWVRNAMCDDEPCWRLAMPVAYFIPEHGVDPAQRPPGDTLWVEVTLPPTGAPRPIRLGVKKGETLQPLEE